MDSQTLVRPASQGRSDSQSPAHTDFFIRRFMQLLPAHALEAAALAALIEGPIRLPTHSDIHVWGKSATEAVVLLDGMACQYRVLESNRRQIISFITPGDFCDFSFLSSSPVRQSLMTLGPAMIGRINLAQLANLANGMPAVVLAGMRAASIQQASAQELIVSFGTRDALQRLAHLLCEIYVRLKTVGCVSESGQFDFPLTQSELGEALGLSNVHVNRTIQQLRKGKFVVMGHGRVTMLDFDGLGRIATFSADYLRSS